MRQLSCLGCVFAENAYSWVDTIIVIQKSLDGKIVQANLGHSLLISSMFLIICLVALILAFKALFTHQLKRSKWVMSSMLAQSSFFLIKMTYIDKLQSIQSDNLTPESSYYVLGTIYILTLFFNLVII